MKKLNRVIAICITASLLFTTGCGKKTVQAPELLEPVSANESYRPVEVGTVGLSGTTSGVIMGVVVPKEYCHFYKTTVTIKEVYVNIGDYVNEGDILAVADVEEASRTKASFEKQLSGIVAAKKADDKIYEASRSILEYEKKAADSKKLEKQKQSELDVLDENKRYDDLMYEHSCKDLREDIAKQQEIIDDGTLKARTSGYVVYSRDISMPYTTVANNVVIIADYNDCYIEVNDVSGLSSDYRLRDFNLSKFDACYTYINGQKKNLIEYPYTYDEKVVAESRNSIPPVRLKLEDGSVPYDIGSCIPVFVIRTGAQNVVRVCKDSLYKDGDGDYVYVKKGDGNEKRYVRLGTTDKNYTEVIEGLSEGEFVYYSSEQVMPSEYDEYEVKKGDYEAVKETKAYVIKDTISVGCNMKYDGTIEELFVNVGDSVSAGDKLCTVKTDIGGATLTELSKNIENIKSAHDDSVKAFKEQEAELDKQLKQLGKEKKKNKKEAQAATETDSEKDKTNKYEREILELRKEIISYEREKEKLSYESTLADMNEEYNNAAKGNDGYGNITLYAEHDGVVGSIIRGRNASVTSGETFLFINVPCERYVCINANKISIGQKVSFETEDGRTYEGEVVGREGSGDERYYLTSMDDKVYVTTSPEGNSLCYIRMSDDSFYELDKTVKVTARYSERSIPDSIVIPRDGVVYSEIDRSSLEGRSYVWKLVDGKPVKTYITVANEDIGGAVYCVIEALSEGDKLAVDFKEEEGEE